MQIDPQQTALVNAGEKRIFGSAGAGSGKTSVLTERVAKLLRDKVSPYDIMCFTFTRKAAGEMKTRIEKVIPKSSDINKLTIGTMHGVAFNLIRKYGRDCKLVSNPETFTVYSQYQEEMLLRRVCMDMSALSNKGVWGYSKSEITSVFEMHYQTGYVPLCDTLSATIYKTFMNRCRENNAMTYGMLITSLFEMLPYLCKNGLLSISHLLVDECQDIDPLQWMIIEYLQKALKDLTLFCVGDIDQSIYSFRGAVPEYLVQNQTTFEIYKLENNYRSEDHIVHGARRLIENNEQRIERTMISTIRNSSDKPVRDRRRVRTEDIAKWVADEKPGTVAVLARTHSLLRKLSMFLADSNVPYVYIGKSDNQLLETEWFAQIDALLHLMVNPLDNFSFMMAMPLFGVDNLHYQNIRLESVNSQGKRSHFQAWLGWSGEAIKTWGHFWFLSKSLIEAMTLLKELIENERVDWTYSKEEFQQVFDFIIEKAQGNNEYTVEDYCKFMSSYGLHDDVLSEIDEDTVVLSTIHGAKGLEFDTVYLFGCNEGILPISRAIKDGKIEEERRLMYVAMTRAKKKLYLCVRPESDERASSENDFQGRKGRKSPPSRFLSEAGV